MKSNNITPAVGRQQQTRGLETLLLWIIIAIGVAGVVILFSGTEKRDTTVLAAEVSGVTPETGSVARLSNP